LRNLAEYFCIHVLRKSVANLSQIVAKICRFMPSYAVIIQASRINFAQRKTAQILENKGI